MSSPFVKIVDGKLNLFPINIKDTEVRILCILGKARMGKSTFLNTFVTHLEGIQPFQTQNNDEHCTRGIDYYFSEKERIILMDCQGLALEDSSHDPALLLFAYLISDVIVFNERMMLQNEALKLLEPICTFMPYLEMNEQKPKLYFRISDGDMVTDVQKNLNKVIHTQYNDQYQTIRDSIQNLFQPEIGIVKTDSFDKKTKTKLQSGDYTVLLEEELGFLEAFRTLYEALPQGESSETWKKNVASYIEQINRNEKISIEKLDIVGQTGKIEILEWMNSLKIYTEPKVDGTQAVYDKLVEPLKKEKQATLTKFTRLFKAIPDSVKQSHRDKLTSLLLAPITNAEKSCEIKAERILHDYVVAAQKNQTFPTLNSNEISFTHRPDSFFHSYFEVFHALLRACDHVYEPIKYKYVKWVQCQFATFQLALDNVRCIEKGYVVSMKKHNSGILTTYHQIVLEHTGKMDNRVLKSTPKNVLELYYKSTFNETMTAIVNMVHPQEIKVVMKGKELSCVISKVSKSPDDIKTAFDRVAPLTIDVTPSSRYIKPLTFEEEKRKRIDYLNLQIQVKSKYIPNPSNPKDDLEIYNRLKQDLVIQRTLIRNMTENDILRSQSKSEILPEYDLVKEEMVLFDKRLSEIAFDKELVHSVTQRKNSLLNGVILSDELIPFLSDVELITHPVGDKKITITINTYVKTYGIIHEETTKTLRLKGYISDTPIVNTVKDNHTTMTIADVPHIQYLFNHQFYKILAKHCVNGFELPCKNEGIPI